MWKNKGEKQRHHLRRIASNGEEGDIKAIPLKIPLVLTEELDKLILRNTWKNKGPKIVKAGLKETNTFTEVSS